MFRCFLHMEGSWYRKIKEYKMKWNNFLHPYLKSSASYIYILSSLHGHKWFQIWFIVSGRTGMPNIGQFYKFRGFQKCLVNNTVSWQIPSRTLVCAKVSTNWMNYLRKIILFGLAKARLKLSQSWSLSLLSNHPPPPPTTQTFRTLPGKVES